MYLGLVQVYRPKNFTHCNISSVYIVGGFPGTMMYLRPHPPSLRVGSWRRSPGLLIHVTSLELHGKSHRFCMQIGEMVVDRLNRHLEQQDVDAGALVLGRFPQILRHTEISGKAWSQTEETVCAMCTRYHEMMGGAPVDLRFLVWEKQGDIALELRDARAVDRIAQCREVVVLLLHPNVIRYQFIAKDVRVMLARMVWSARCADVWDPQAGPQTKAEEWSSSKKHRSSYWEGSEADDHVGSEEDSGDSASFSDPGESSSSEDESCSD